MMLLWSLICLGFICSLAVVNGQFPGDSDCRLVNTEGCRIIKEATYVVLAPRKIRPMESVNISVSLLSLPTSNVTVSLAIRHGYTEHGFATRVFTTEATHIMTIPFQHDYRYVNPTYHLWLEGRSTGADTGSYPLFWNRTDLEFDGKVASIFVQLSKPVYKQRQTIRFRVFAITADLLQMNGGVTIYVLDPSGFPVKRWLAVGTRNWYLSKQLKLADKPRFGKWSIKVEGFGQTYQKQFHVIESRETPFHVSVVVPRTIMADFDIIRGSITAARRGGQAIIGNVTITATTMRSDGVRLRLSFLSATDHFSGQVDFNISRHELGIRAGGIPITEGMRFVFSVTVRDLSRGLEQTSRGETVVISSGLTLKWVGGKVHTFKPGSHFTATIAAMHADGSPVTKSDHNVTVTVMQEIFGGSSSSNTLSEPLVNGLATFSFPVNTTVVSISLTAGHPDNSLGRSVELKAARYHSDSGNYISVSTSTLHPRINEFMIIHVRTRRSIPSQKLHYLVMSKGNILKSGEKEMSNLGKTFHLVVTKDMAPAARIIVYHIQQPNEVVVDTLNFFINSTSSASMNLSKAENDQPFVSVHLKSDPNSTVGIAAIPVSMFEEGFNNGLTDSQIIAELLTYDKPADSIFHSEWKRSHEDLKYKFLTSHDNAIDVSSALHDAGLQILSDAVPVAFGDRCDDMGMRACFNGFACYPNSSRCDGLLDCADWADEQGCDEENAMIDGNNELSEDIVNLMGHQEDDEWLWQTNWIPSSGTADISVKVPSYKSSWMVSAFTISDVHGLSIVSKPVMVTTSPAITLYMESPSHVVLGEQILVYVTLANHLLPEQGSLNVALIVNSSTGVRMGNSLNNGTTNESKCTSKQMVKHRMMEQLLVIDNGTTVVLAAGETRSVYLIVIPVIAGEVDVKVSATSHLGTQTQTNVLHVQDSGITNHYHTPYLVDLIQRSLVVIPALTIPVPENPMRPEERERQYVPGSSKSSVSLIGDVIPAGLFEDTLNAQNVLGMPFGSGEQEVFNFAYNAHTLRYRKQFGQLSDEVEKQTLKLMSEGLQRLLTYMSDNGGFSMFPNHGNESVWLTAFAVKTIDAARFGEWDLELYIPIEVLGKAVTWLCQQQQDDGSFYEQLVFDRKMSKITDQPTHVYGDKIPLTAYVLIALSSRLNVPEQTNQLLLTTSQKARVFLEDQVQAGMVSEPFHLAITAYALKLTHSAIRTSVMAALQQRSFQGEEMYWADEAVPANPSSIMNSIRYLQPREEVKNEAYAVQTTAYVLLAKDFSAFSYEINSIVRWLCSMKNSPGGFVSTQDTIVAIEALLHYKLDGLDTTPNIHDVLTELESSAVPGWRIFDNRNSNNYTNLLSYPLPRAYGTVEATAQGTGRVMLQLSTSVNVEFAHLVKQPAVRSFDLQLYSVQWRGIGSSIINMTVCSRWRYTTKSIRSGLTVMEVEVPSGFVVPTDTLQDYVKAGTVPSLSKAEFINRLVYFYFDFLTAELTCVTFHAERWLPVINATGQYLMRIYEYYEPGLHNTTLYSLDCIPPV